MKEALKNIAIIILISGIFVGAIVGLPKFEEYKRNQALENPPTAQWLEEDLESYLFSTSLSVEKYETDDNILIGIVKETNREKYYIFAYKLEGHDGGVIVPAYDWEFSHYLEIEKQQALLYISGYQSLWT